MYIIISTSVVLTELQIRLFLKKDDNTLDLLQKCFLQEVGKGKRLKGKVGSQEGDKGRGKIQNLSQYCSGKAFLTRNWVWGKG